MSSPERFSTAAFEPASANPAGFLSADDLRQLGVTGGGPTKPGEQPIGLPQAAPGNIYDSVQQQVQQQQRATYPQPQLEGYPTQAVPLGKVHGDLFPPGYVPGVTDRPPDLPRLGMPPLPAQTARPDVQQPFPAPGGSPYYRQDNQHGPIQSDSWHRQASSSGQAGNFVIDRLGSLAATAYMGSALTEPLASKVIQEGSLYPSLAQYKSVQLPEWKAAATNHMGIAMLGSWAADTALDMTVLSNQGTSWKTMVVDVGTPLITHAVFGRLGTAAPAINKIAVSIGLSALAHSAEKLIVENSIDQ